MEHTHSETSYFDYIFMKISTILVIKVPTYHIEENFDFLAFSCQNLRNILYSSPLPFLILYFLKCFYRFLFRILQ